MEVIKQIQTDTLLTTQIMNTNAKAVEHQVELVSRGGEALYVILKNVDQTKDYTQLVNQTFVTLQRNIAGELAILASALKAEVARYKSNKLN